MSYDPSAGLSLTPPTGSANPGANKGKGTPIGPFGNAYDPWAGVYYPAPDKGKHVKGGVYGSVRYWDGDQYKALAGRSPGDIWAFQEQAAKVGLLDASKIQPGVADRLTLNAMAQLMAEANGWGGEPGGKPGTWEQVLSDRNATADAAGFNAAASQGKQRQQLPLQTITNPDEVKAIFNDSSTRMIGRKLTPDELNQMQSAFTQTQQSANAAQDAAYLAGGGSANTVTNPASVTNAAWLRQQFRDKFTNEYDTSQLGQQSDQLIKLMQDSGGPGGMSTAGGRP